MASIPELVDRPRAAELLGGVSIKTVDRLRKRGAIVSCSIGERSIRIEVDSIGAYLARRRNGGQSESDLKRKEEEDPLFAIPALQVLKQKKARQRVESAGPEEAA